MEDPILKALRGIRARRSRQLRNGFARAAWESQQLLEKVCDVIVLANGEKQYIASRQRVYDYFMAPRLAKQQQLAHSARLEEKTRS
jgi:hypothetical protein